MGSKFILFAMIFLSSGPAIFSFNTRLVECEVGFLVFEYSKYLLDNVMTNVRDRLPLIFDALNLHHCNGTRPQIAASTRLSASEEILLSSHGKKIYVDPVRGSDDGRGDVKQPLRSLKAALLDSRKTMEPAVIILRGGLYQLDSTLVLDNRDSGLSIINFPHEEPVLSGGRELALDWHPWPCPALARRRAPAMARAAAASCWSASTAAADLAAIDFTQLFLRNPAAATADRRAVRARHPNAGEAPRAHQGPCRTRPRA